MLEINQSHVRKTLINYQIGELLSLDKISGGYSNTNYKIVTQAGIYIYRVCQLQSLASMHYEMKLLKALKQIHFPAAFPVYRKDGEYFNIESHGCVTIYHFIQGNHPEINHKTVKEIASVVGNLGNFSDWQKLPRKNTINIESCHALIQNFKIARYKYLDIFEYFAEQTEYLSLYFTEAIPKGIVHGDIFPDNTIFRGDQLAAIIDFEFASLDYLLVDVGMTINGFCFLRNRLDKDLLVTFLQSYNNVRKFRKRELEILPYYIQWGAHGMISSHLEHHLLERKNTRQLNRVNELMERVRILRAHEAAAHKIIQNVPWLN